MKMAEEWTKRVAQAAASAREAGAEWPQVYEAFRRAWADLGGVSVTHPAREPSAAAQPATRPPRRRGGLLVNVYEPGPGFGFAQAFWRLADGGIAQRYRVLRRRRLVYSGFLKRETQLRPLYDVLRLPGRSPRAIVAVGCEGRALAVHVAADA